MTATEKVVADLLAKGVPMETIIAGIKLAAKQVAADIVAGRGEFQNAEPRCGLGVGCGENSVCYADAHGQPDRCGMQSTCGTEACKAVVNQKADR